MELVCLFWLSGIGAREGKSKMAWSDTTAFFGNFVKPPFPRDGLSIVVIILETLEPSPA
jgi:hypothetical protein